MKKTAILIIFCLTNISFAFGQASFDPAQHKMIHSDRTDGLFISTYGVTHSMLESTVPKYAFRRDFSGKELKRWQNKVRMAMIEIMKHPQLKEKKAPVCVLSEQKEGYRQEKWEFYPLPSCVSTFYVLIPDGLKVKSPAVLCIPGSGMTKENLIGRVPSTNIRAAMALNIVKRGYIAVAVDNAAAGEASDLSELAHSSFDYETPSRILLELGWSYLGYTSYLNKKVLEWMKSQPSIRTDRIVVSGFSLGTEPLMVLGVMDPSIYAFVYNDFLCQTQERALVMTAPDSKGHRPFPNSIRHLIPGFWNYFNFPDIVASLAPRPLILTEGGLDRDLDLVKCAYEISGHAGNVEIHHYKKYEQSENRNKTDALPEGLNRTDYYESVNVDGVNHYFKNEYVLPWLDKILK